MTAPDHQVPQWLFAFDPAGMTTFRALALLASPRAGGTRGQGNGAGSAALNVHRTSQNEFHIFSQSPDSEGNTRVKAWCERLQLHLDMPVSFTITADTDLQ